jgi:hypothetical protein
MKMSEQELGLMLDDRIHSCETTDEKKARSLIRDLYRKSGHPKPSLPILFVQSPAHAIAEVAKIYRQSMNKVEDGFMLRLQLPNADPVLVKSGVQYPTFLKWDFAAALFRVNKYVKSDSWAYSLQQDRPEEDMRQITLDIRNMVGLHMEDWRRWSEAGEHTDVFRNTTGYWPIARNAAFGRRRQFPGCALNRVRVQSDPDKELTPVNRVLLELAEATFLVYPFDNFIVVLDFPEAIHMDEQGRLGRMGGAAIEWRDGTGTYAVSGRAVAKSLATGRLTMNKILSQNNAEVKRVLIAHFGEEEFLEAIKAEPVAEDKYGILYHADSLPNENEQFAMVAVKNSTPEPDGSVKTYYLRVSPQARTPEEAVARSFQIDGAGRATDWRLRGLIQEGHWKYNPGAES